MLSEENIWDTHKCWFCHEDGKRYHPDDKIRVVSFYTLLDIGERFYHIDCMNKHRRELEYRYLWVEPYPKIAAWLQEKECTYQEALRREKDAEL